MTVSAGPETEQQRTAGSAVRSPGDRRLQWSVPKSMLVSVLVVAAAMAAFAGPVWLLFGDRSSAEAADSVQIGINRLSAATLDIEVGTVSTSLDARAMAPGDVSVGSVELSNVGTLPLVYALRGAGGAGPLAPWLRWTGWIDDSPCADGATARARAATTGSSNVQAQVGRLEPGEVEVLCFAAYLPVDAPNIAQGESLFVNLVVDAEQAVD